MTAGHECMHNHGRRRSNHAMANAKDGILGRRNATGEGEEEWNVGTTNENNAGGMKKSKSEGCKNKKCKIGFKAIRKNDAIRSMTGFETERTKPKRKKDEENVGSQFTIVIWYTHISFELTWLRQPQPCPSRHLQPSWPLRQHDRRCERRRVAGNCDV